MRTHKRYVQTSLKVGRLASKASSSKTPSIQLTSVKIKTYLVYIRLNMCELKYTLIPTGLALSHEH